MNPFWARSKRVAFWFPLENRGSTGFTVLFYLTVVKSKHVDTIEFRELLLPVRRASCVVGQNSAKTLLLEINSKNKMRGRERRRKQTGPHEAEV